MEGGLFDVSEVVDLIQGWKGRVVFVPTAIDRVRLRFERAGVQVLAEIVCAIRVTKRESC